MEALSERQIDWIYLKAGEFTKRWASNIPRDDAEWLELMNNAKDIYAKSRNNVLLKQLLLQSINYIDSLSDGNRKPLEML